MEPHQKQMPGTLATSSRWKRLVRDRVRQDRCSSALSCGLSVSRLTLLAKLNRDPVGAWGGKTVRSSIPQGIPGRPAVCIPAPPSSTSWRLLRPGAPESPGIPPRCVGGGLSLGPGRPPTSAAAPRPRRPRSRSQTRAVWTLRGPRSAAPPAGGSGPPRSVTRRPLLGAGVRVRRAAPRPSGKKSRAPLRAPGLPVRSAPPDRPPTARSPGRPRARYCGRPAPRAQRPGLRGSGGERRAAALRRGPARTPRLGCSCCGSPSPALARSPGTWRRSFGAAGTRSCVRLGVGARRRESEDADGRHTALHPAARGVF